MDNGVLLLIIVALAAFAIWQTSKLKQFEKLEQMLQRNADNNASAEPSKRTTGSTSSSQADDLPGLPPVAVEDNIEEGNKVQLVKARCRYAEFYIEQLDDEFEREQFQSIVHDCVAIAKQISDPFYQSAALQPLILLLDSAGWNDLRDDLLNRVEDEHIKAAIGEEMSAEATA